MGVQGHHLVARSGSFFDLPASLAFGFPEKGISTREPVGEILIEAKPGAVALGEEWRGPVGGWQLAIGNSCPVTPSHLLPIPGLPSADSPDSLT